MDEHPGGRLTVEPGPEDALDLMRGARAVENLRTHYDRLRRQERESWLRHAGLYGKLRIRLGRVGRSAETSLTIAASTVRAVREYGAFVSKHEGVSLPKQALHQLYLSHAYRLPPDCYYFLRMYETSVRERAHLFLDDIATSVILQKLAARFPDENEVVENKQAFWQHFTTHGLPTVPILAVFANGTIRDDYGGVRRNLPAEDLFSKPVDSFLGKGARKWIYADEGYYEGGRLRKPEAVVDMLEEQSKDETLLLQPCVSDHLRLQELTGGAGPSTLRIITMRMPDGPPEYFAGFLTIPRKSEAAPTFTERTALAARVDQTGQLGKLLYKQSEYLPDGRERHPATEIKAVGFKLPYWCEARELAIQAHRTLPHIACVGWDIMLTADGPLLLEGNNDCSAALTQITQQRLLGVTRFPLVIDAHVELQE